MGFLDFMMGLTNQKSGLTCVFPYNCARIKVDSYDSKFKRYTEFA